MSSWKRNLNPNKPNNTLFEASAAEAFFKLQAIVHILQWAQAQLQAEAPHKDILAGIEARLAVGLKRPTTHEEPTP